MVGSMPRVGAVDEPPPGRGALLGLAHQDQDQPTPTDGQRRVLIGTGDVFFRFAALEPHQRHPGGRHQTVEFGDEPLAVAVDDRRGGDAIPPVEEELHHATLVLEALDVASDPDAVHRGAAEADVLGQ
jgi:hypothetical protein